MKDMAFGRSALAVAVALAVGALAFGLPMIPPMKTSSDWAAWMQAIGSVGAIIGTAGTGLRSKTEIEDFL